MLASLEDLQGGGHGVTDTSLQDGRQERRSDATTRARGLDAQHRQVPMGLARMHPLDGRDPLQGGGHPAAQRPAQSRKGPQDAGARRSPLLGRGPHRATGQIGRRLHLILG